MQTLKQVIKELNKKREDALAQVGEVIGLAAKAGNIIVQARADGEDMVKLVESAGITDEQAKRYERVAAHQHKLNSGEPGVVRQLLLWSEMLPDPITTSEPGEPKPFLSPVIRVAQWVANRGLRCIKQDEDLRRQFLLEARPIVAAYRELGGDA
ncbi:MAG: hypothetical protein EBR40_08195 [Proteobacteria bacterium]|nr:hypothetical protein [Pseudomonadota bacterium]